LRSESGKRRKSEREREREREREEERVGERASLSPRGETESVPMIGCIPRERGLEERVDRGGEAFNTCGTVLPLSIKRIGWITISTPRTEKEGERQRGRRREPSFTEGILPGRSRVTRYGSLSAVFNAELLAFVNPANGDGEDSHCREDP